MSDKGTNPTSSGMCRKKGIKLGCQRDNGVFFGTSNDLGTLLEVSTRDV